MKDYLLIRKKMIIFLLLAGVLLAAVYPLANAAPQQVTVYLDEILLQFDVQPQYRQEKLMVPLRRVYEQAGYEVTWEPDTKRVLLRRGDRAIVLLVDNPLYSVNEIVYRASQAPFIERGRTMVGLDFLEESSGITVTHRDDYRGILRLSSLPEVENGSSTDFPGDQGADDHLLTFIEILLPPGNQVEVGESFEIKIATPPTEGIFSYEIQYYYDSNVIKINDIKNPSYIPEREFCLKNIDNKDGLAKYTQTNLGFMQEMPSRECLAVIEAVSLCKGEVPFLKDNIMVEVLNNAAHPLPVALEEKILYVGPAR